MRNKRFWFGYVVRNKAAENAVRVFGLQINMKAIRVSQVEFMKSSNEKKIL